MAGKSYGCDLEREIALCEGNVVGIGRGFGFLLLEGRYEGMLR